MQELSNVNLMALRAVEAVARCGTLREAAEELGVTPGAISQQVIKAEDQLDRQLFERTPKGMVPTSKGAAVADYLNEGFTALAQGVSLTRRSREDVITVSVAPVFAMKWLVSRLGRFAQAQPDIRVQIDASVDLVEPRYGAVDACIRVGTGNWPRVRVEEMLSQRVFPVCAPSLADKLRELSVLTRVPIIRERAYRLFGWDAWLTPNNMTDDQLGDGPVFSDASLCLDAAMAGQGVFLGLETLVQDTLNSGRLVAPFPGRFPIGVSYWFVEPEARRRPPQVEAFKSWLFAELKQGRRV